jgi:hypothetical protein
MVGAPCPARSRAPASSSSLSFPPPQPQRYPFSFCRHAFVYDPASKARVLQLENQITQYQQFESSMMQARSGIEWHAQEEGGENSAVWRGSRFTGGWRSGAGRRAALSAPA